MDRPFLCVCFTPCIYSTMSFSDFRWSSQAPSPGTSRLCVQGHIFLGTGFFRWKRASWPKDALWPPSFWLKRLWSVPLMRSQILAPWRGGLPLVPPGKQSLMVTPMAPREYGSVLSLTCQRPWQCDSKLYGRPGWVCLGSTGNFNCWSGSLGLWCNQSRLTPLGRSGSPMLGATVCRLRPNVALTGGFRYVSFHGFQGQPCSPVSSWWFEIFFVFTPTWGRFRFWLIFFKGVETTNQVSVQDPWWSFSSPQDRATFNVPLPNGLSLHGSFHGGWSDHHWNIHWNPILQEDNIWIGAFCQGEKLWWTWSSFLGVDWWHFQLIV